MRIPGVRTVQVIKKIAVNMLLRLHCDSETSASELLASYASSRMYILDASTLLRFDVASLKVAEFKNIYPHYIFVHLYIYI